MTGVDIWFGLLGDEESEGVEDLLTGSVVCGACGATLQTYPSKCNVPTGQPCVGFLCVEGARLHLRRLAALAKDAA